MNNHVFDSMVHGEVTIPQFLFIMVRISHPKKTPPPLGQKAESTPSLGCCQKLFKVEGSLQILQPASSQHQGSREKN